jgi:hypothetical protein
MVGFLRKSLLDYAKPYGIMRGMAAEKLNSEALEFFRQAGKRGGKKRFKAMSKKERTELAKRAAAARWKSKEKP